MKGSTVAALVLAGLFSTGIVEAAPTRVVVIADADTEVAAKRIDAELHALGFDVVHESMGPTTTPDELDSVARDHSAVATLRVRPSARGFEIWIADRVTGKTTFRRIDLPGDGRDVLALEAVELLRASFLELQLPSFRPTDVPPPPETRAVVAPPPAGRPRLSPSGPSVPPAPPAFALRLGPALVWSPDGLAPTVHLELGVRWRSRGPLGAAIELLAPTAPVYVETAAGRASFRLQTATVRLEGFITDRQSPWLVWTHGAFGVAWAHMEGASVSPGFVPQGDDVVTALGLIGAGLGRTLGPRARLFLEASLGLSLPRIVMRFADQDVGAWGRPLVLVSTGLEVTF